MKRFIILVVAALVAAGILQSQHRAKIEPAITAGEIQDHINYLASDALEGRFTGSKGCRLAGRYIEEEFSLYGLKSAFGDSYFQPFPFVAERKLTENNTFRVSIAGKNYSLQLRKDFIPFTFSDNTDFSGEVVFAGYGISAPELHYDDYAGLDVKGKILLVLRSHPEGDRPRSKFDRFAGDRFKATTARDKGAKAIILANGVLPARKEDRLERFRYDRSGPVKGIAVLQITRRWLEKILAAEGKSLAGIQKKINTQKLPVHFVLKNTAFSGRVEIEEVKGTGRNVAGILYGRDPLLKDEYLVIGAHYDHLGWGKVGSLYRGDKPQIHNGADDNASGTAGLLELAEKFASVKDRLKRSLLFVAFSGEELGSIGATYFVKHSPVPLGKMAAMINMDMIGRMRPDSSLIIYGTGTSARWKELLNRENSAFGFHLTFHDEGYGPSDHAIFYAQKIPVLFFFTGTHADYHRPTDDADKINSTGEAAVVRYVYRIAADIDTFARRPNYIAVAQRGREGRRSFKVYVGTIPDFSGNTNGYKISGVSENSPAARAGMQGGDVIIEFGGRPVSNIYDFTYALQNYAPGDTVEVVFLRNGKKKRITIELDAR